MMEKPQQYKDLFNLRNKVAIVTGGYGHLGSSMSKALTSFGAKVIVFGRAVRKTIDFDGYISYVQCDVTDTEKVKQKIYRAEMECQYLADGLDVVDLI